MGCYRIIGHILKKSLESEFNKKSLESEFNTHFI